MSSATALLATTATATATALSPPTPTPSNCTTQNSTEYIGPSSGNLVIIGGNLSNTTIYSKIISLAGGPTSPIIVIPTAGGADTYNETFPAAETFRRLGATNVTVLHTYDPKEADTEEFIAPLRDAGGIFFGGGRQWRLVDAYAGTKAEAAFRAVLDRGGVISGSSAGASIQGSFLARGDTANNQVMIGDHTVGFGYLKNTAIDQHFLVRNRHFDMFDILSVHPELLGIAIDENTAVVVNQNNMEVLGPSYVAIYDGTFYSDEGTELKTIPPKESRFYFLRDGQRYDLGARKVVEDEALAATGRDEL